MRCTLIISLAFCVQFAVCRQEKESTDSSFVEEVQWEKLLETATQDDQASSIFEEVAQFEEHPLNLNTASQEELHFIPAISNIVASRIVARRKVALFTDVDELLEVEGITPELLSFIRQYVRVGRQGDPFVFKGSITSRTSTELEERKGFINGEYPGSPVKVLHKIRASLEKTRAPVTSVFSSVEVGALIKKDPGELRNASFLSGYTSFSLSALSACFILGDYQVEAAEGLVFWSASMLSKGSDIVAPTRKNGGGIHPYLSSDENSSFRGIAGSMEFGPVQTQIFYSNKLINAAIDSLGRISSIDRSGLFRTESELSRLNSSREAMIGYRVVVHLFDGLKIGGTGFKTQFANPFLLKGKSGFSVFELCMHGMDISYTKKNVDVFSELSFDLENTCAMMCGITYEPVRTLELALAVRRYPPEFQDIHGNAFGESGRQVQNENGVYSGIKVQPIPWLCISTYYDQFEHPKSTATIPASSYGNDFLLLVECNITRQFMSSIRFKKKDSPSLINENDLQGRIINQIVPRVQNNYRLDSEFHSSLKMQLAWRAEWVTVHYDGMDRSESGLLLSQSIRWTLFKRFTVQTRHAVFETYSYDSCIYEFEDDLPGVYSNPALFGRGYRWYLILRYEFAFRSYITVKIVQTIKEGIKSIGEGLDEIKGNSQSTLSAQLNICF